MTDEFRPPKAIPWDTLIAAPPIADMRLIHEYLYLAEPFDGWCRRMNTSDEPEAVEFRRRWGRTESGRGDKP